MAESTHRCELVPVELLTHPNADALSIVKIDGYQVVVRTEDWKGIRQGVYIPPDSVCPLSNPRFAFLKDPKKPDQIAVRVKARRLRGEWSMGLLVPGPVDGVEWHDWGFPTIGDDVATWLGVTHYDPPEPMSTGGETDAPPKRVKTRRPCASCHGLGIVEDPQHGHSLRCEPCAGKGYPNDAEEVTFDYPKYDVEAFRKYGRKVFKPGEPLWITEKIHGTNGRWVFDGDRYHCGSHKEWKRYSESNVWWKALANTPALSNFLFMNPGTAVYGEVYGQVQDLKYGTAKNEIRVAVFDILHDGKWVDAADLATFQPNPEGPPAWTLPWVPNLNGGLSTSLVYPKEGYPTFDFEWLLELAEGPSLIPGADHIREGIVIRPLRERWDSHCGRISLKIVSNNYMERA